MKSNWDRAALSSGAAVTAMFAVPFTLAAVWFGDRDNGTAALICNLITIGGFVLGAGCAAWTQDVGMPISHGLLTAVATYLAVRAFFLITDILQGDDINWFAVVFALTLALATGLVGGWLGARLHAKGFRPSSKG